MVAFVALGTLVLVLAAIVGIRVWWFNRKLRKAHGSQRREGRGASVGRIDVIEGEYRDVSREDRDRS